MTNKEQREELDDIVATNRNHNIGSPENTYDDRGVVSKRTYQRLASLLTQARAEERQRIAEWVEKTQAIYPFDDDEPLIEKRSILTFLQETDKQTEV